MLKRKIEKTLLEWKQEKGHNPLVIKGCRQCGKTYAVEKFGKENYSEVIYLNFFKNPEYCDLFKHGLDVDTILMYMSVVLRIDISKLNKESLFIFDEIQECPEARTSLKFWKTDGRFDVIATGSLLGIKGYKEAVSVPVGYETIVKMYPLDFEEFLWGCGITEDIITHLRKKLEAREPIEEPIHKRLRELLTQYIVVGGMPAVVWEFCNSGNFTKVLRMQRAIVEEYKEDMVKYASNADKAVIKECFESIPKQLAKENKKFQYSLVKKGSTASKYSGSLQWIEDAGIINRCYNMETPELPLEGNSMQDVFKVYMQDTGLFVSMLEDGTQADIINGNLYTYKGAVFENLIADIFSKMGRKLYYYHKDSGLEIDFVTRFKGQCAIVEVKAVTGNTKSAKTILMNTDKYHVSRCIKIGDYNLGEEGKIMTIPHYLAFLLDTY